MRHKASLPLLIDALLDSDSNVRIQAIDSLSCYLGKGNPRGLNSEQCLRVVSAVDQCLDDKSSGVVIRALAFLAQNKKHLSTDNLPHYLERIIERGCTKEDFLYSAANALRVISLQQSASLLINTIENQAGEQQQVMLLQMLAIVLKKPTN